MRTLKFIVEGQVISQDPNCDFSKLVPGSEGYIQAEFSFSPEWDGYTKVVAFFSNLGREFQPQKLDYKSTCVIPAEVLKRSIFKIQVVGQKGSNKLRTNKVVVRQRGDNV